MMCKKTGINFDNYDDIPVETTGNDIPDPIDTYSIDTIGEELMRNTQLCGYNKPTPVQKYSVPIGNAGRDLMACAQTGSGKTAGFLFPVIMSMLKLGGSTPPSDGRRRNYPNALVLAPTRELASQIHEESRKFTYCTGIAAVVIYGGADVRDQLRQIERGCDLLIATPGRLVDLIERGRLSMENVRFLCLDEADRMLDMGFEQQLRKIASQIRPDRQVLMWSATWPPSVQNLARDYLTDYYQVTVGSLDLTGNKDVTQEVVVCNDHEKYGNLLRYLKENLTDKDRVLVFVETKKGCDMLTRSLRADQFQARAMHGDKSQDERDWVLREFKSRQSTLLCATDVAARGLDVDDIRMVVNFDMPNDMENYIHRIGRTGRAGKKGTAVSFFVADKNGRTARELVEILSRTEQNIPPELQALSSFSGGRGRGRGGRRY